MCLVVKDFNIYSCAVSGRFAVTEGCITVCEVNNLGKGKGKGLDFLELVVVLFQP